MRVAAPHGELGARRGARSAPVAALVAFVALGLLVEPPAGAQDSLSLPAIEALPGTTRVVPVYVRDVSGTTLDEGDGANFEIQGFSFQVYFAPAASVTSADFVQAGVTAGKSPVFPVVTPSVDNIFVILNFDAESDPLAFTLDAAAPGNVVGELRFAISPSATLGSTIALTLATGNAALVNDSATLSETVANGQLELGDGSILLDGDVFADGFEAGDTCGWSSTVPTPACP